MKKKKKKKKTAQETFDEIAAAQLSSGSSKSQPPPVHPAMADTENNPDANATDASPDDDGDYDEDRTQ